MRSDKDMKFTSCKNVDCNKEYDFNDLIDVAVQAYKDGVLNFFEVGSDGASKYILATHNENDLLFHHGDSSYNHAVKYINSLYTEKFVIENDIDILKLKGEPKITLSNGNEFVAIDMKISSNSRGMHAICFIDIDSYEMVYSFFELKGAKVTQKRNL